MQHIKEKLRNINIPINTGSLALFISLIAVGFVASATNTPCLQAQSTCAVGGESVFSGDIGIKGGTTYVATLDASGISADRTITIPNADGTILLGGGLGASKVVATDVSGDLTTTNVYPLSIGTSGQVLTVDATNTFLEYSSITGVPSLTATKSVSTDGAGALTTNDVYPLTLTASTPLKTNGAGEVTANDLDITTDITPGTALQEIRVNAGATALEYFTPSGGGGRWSLVAQGQAEHYYGDMTICWYDDTQGTGIGGGLDQTKVYKLVVEPTLPFQASFYPNNSSYPAMVPMADTSCSTMPSSSNYLFNSSVTNNGLWATSYYGYKTTGEVYNAPWLGYQQGTTANSSSNRCGGASIEMTMRNGIDLNGGSANTLNQGIKVDVSAHAPCFNTLDITGFQAQDSRGLFFDSLQAPSTPGVNNMNQFNGVMLKRYDMQSGAGAGTPPVWYLYESAH